ncbi:MAG TPA: XRE family transcriptional regulator [Anaerolineales bacterium]|nr:XRE family transcriptional regulator [Anaerolineales bacterium]
MQLGERIKERRKEQQLSLRELAEQVDLTASFLSKIELGQSSPSIESLRKIADALQVPIFYFLVESTSKSPVVRRAERLRLVKPNVNVVWELVSPDTNHRMEAFLFEQEPGGGNWADPPHTYTEEMIYVLSGTLGVDLLDGSYTLQEGDTIYFEGTHLRALYNAGDTRVKVLAIITPPIV